MKDVTLYHNDPASRTDKVYRAWIEPNGKAFAVRMAYGRRGGTMQTGSKGVDFSLDGAEAVHYKLIAEKLAKGYKPGEDATAVVVPTKTASGETVGGWIMPPMLLNEVSCSEVGKLAEDPQWLVQMKFDGVRVQLQRIGTQVLAFSRTNKSVSLPKPIVEAMAGFPVKGDVVLDGEIIGDTVYLFDMLRYGAWEGAELPYQERLTRLYLVLDANKIRGKALQEISTAYSSEEKAAAITCLKEQGAEGVVFKHRDAKYSPGRPNSGGNALKHKFVTTASVIVGMKKEGKDSFEMLLSDGSSVGYCTVPPNKPHPSPLKIAEVRYLYAHRGGSLVQPVFLGVREDIEPHECTVDQLQFKGEQRCSTVAS